MRYRRISVGVLAFALALALVASGGFSAAELDRGSAIQIVDDDRAAVGLQACYLPNEAAQRTNGGESGGPENENDRANRVTPIGVEITNRLGAELTVRELTVDGAIVNDRPYAATIGPGQRERVTIPVRAEPSAVTAIVSANGVSTRITVSDISQGGCPFTVNVPPSEGDETGSDNDEADDSGEGNNGNSGTNDENTDNGEDGDNGNNGNNDENGEDGNSGESGTNGENGS